MRRRRGCGQLRKGKILGTTCGLRFTTIELPAGSHAEVKIALTMRGLEAEIVRKKP